jgi:hypothetical protein
MCLWGCDPFVHFDIVAGTLINTTMIRQPFLFASPCDEFMVPSRLSLSSPMTCFKTTQKRKSGTGSKKVRMVNHELRGSQE